MPQSKRLVVEHLEDISRKTLVEYPEVIRPMLRGRHGVYALYRRDKLYYVGLAKNLMMRLRQHLKDGHGQKWDRFSAYITVHDQHMKELESLLLRIGAPKGNKQSGKFMDSSNLRPKVNKAIKDADDDRRALLLGGRVARQRRRSKTRNTKGSIALAGVVDRRMVLLGWYKGWEYRASLRRDGQINYGGTLYSSPTAAAKAVLKRTVNGWGFWHYRNKKGEWVRLGTLRR